MWLLVFLLFWQFSCISPHLIMDIFRLRMVWLGILWPYCCRKRLQEKSKCFWQICRWLQFVVAKGSSGSPHSVDFGSKRDAVCKTVSCVCQRINKQLRSQKRKTPRQYVTCYLFELTRITNSLNCLYFQILKKTSWLKNRKGRKWGWELILSLSWVERRKVQKRKSS